MHILKMLNGPFWWFVRLFIAPLAIYGAMIYSGQSATHIKNAFISGSFGFIPHEIYWFAESLFMIPAFIASLIPTGMWLPGLILSAITPDKDVFLLVVFVLCLCVKAPEFRTHTKLSKEA